MLETLVFVILCVPVTIFIVTVYILSALGKSLGFRRKYVKCLLYIFEYGRKKIEKANREKYGTYENEHEGLEEDDDVTSTSSSEGETSGPEGQDANANRDKGEGKHVTPKQAMTNHNGKIGKKDEENKLINRFHPNLASGDNDLKIVQDEDTKMILEPESDFELSDIFQFVRSGIEAIVEDQVTQRFASEELKSWNLLTRTNRHYEFISWRLSFIWVVGFFIRYFVMLPFRVTICFLGVVFLTMSTALVGCIPNVYHSLKQRLYKLVYLEAFEFLSWSLSAVVSHHHLENRPGVAQISVEGTKITTGGGICVANHTSPIDVLVLAVDQCYDMVGQRHGGFLGVLQRALARASSHIWFERSEMKDREAVARRLKEHVEDSNKLPILIFPEGTCINNSAVMQFKKGSFEVGGVIYPVAIKYDARFGDPFWDSSNYSMVQYLLMMMSSWAIVCDVWYLPPMIRKHGESAVDFANRVKAEIARKGGLVDLDWDGQLKRAPAKKEWKEQQQLEYSKKFVNSPRRQINVEAVTSSNDNPNPST